MKNEDILKVKEALATPKKIVIIPHRNPDGDAMGSCLGLYHFLCLLNHEVQIISPNEFPDFLAWMPGSENILIFEKDKDITSKIMHEAQMVFTLDFNALHRVGEQMEAVLKALTVPFVMIDHHEKPDTYATVTYSDTSFGSTCEMIYKS
jgi:bifunctional oligoribonuclease and PAP phosphatase NrnA